MARIETILAREILDSRGNPTVEAEVILDDGTRGRAACPSGASKGTFEAVELRDGDERRFGGRGVLRAVANIKEKIAPELSGRDAEDQEGIDRRLIELDGTPNKATLGANATLAVSLAVAKAAAGAAHLPLWRSLARFAPLHRDDVLLPVPLANIINGGRHAHNRLDFQEFLIIPRGFERFSRALQAGVEVFSKLREILVRRHLATSLGDEGGFAPDLPGNEEAIELILEAIKASGYKSGEEVAIGLDLAASSFFENGLYRLEAERKKLVSAGLLDLLSRLIERYPILSIEDPFAEEDWDAWQAATKKLRGTQLVGDDLFVTNVERLREGIRRRVANAVLIKPNQIGTLTETVACVKLAAESGYRAIISHRSGDTEDPLIAHLAVGLGVGQIKCGSFARSERVAKYNELLRIEEEAGEAARFQDPFPG